MTSSDNQNVEMIADHTALLRYRALSVNAKGESQWIPFEKTVPMPDSLLKLYQKFGHRQQPGSSEEKMIQRLLSSLAVPFHREWESRKWNCVVCLGPARVVAWTPWTLHRVDMTSYFEEIKPCIGYDGTALLLLTHDVHHCGKESCRQTAEALRDRIFDLATKEDREASIGKGAKLLSELRIYHGDSERDPPVSLKKPFFIPEIPNLAIGTMIRAANQASSSWWFQVFEKQDSLKCANCHDQIPLSDRSPDQNFVYRVMTGHDRHTFVSEWYAVCSKDNGACRDAVQKMLEERDAEGSSKCPCCVEVECSNQIVKSSDDEWWQDSNKFSVSALFRLRIFTGDSSLGSNASSMKGKLESQFSVLEKTVSFGAGLAKDYMQRWELDEAEFQKVFSMLLGDTTKEFIKSKSWKCAKCQGSAGKIAEPLYSFHKVSLVDKYGDLPPCPGFDGTAYQIVGNAVPHCGKGTCQRYAYGIRDRLHALADKEDVYSGVGVGAHSLGQLQILKSAELHEGKASIATFKKPFFLPSEAYESIETFEDEVYSAYWGWRCTCLASEPFSCLHCQVVIPPDELDRSTYFPMFRPDLFNLLLIPSCFDPNAPRGEGDCRKAATKLTKKMRKNGAIRCACCNEVHAGNACFYCGDLETRPGPVLFKRCSVCKKAIYCSKDCQKKDWAEHKKVCKPVEIEVVGSMNEASSSSAAA